jgi:hypothetical protein
MLRGFLTDEKRSAFITYHCPGNMIENYLQNLRHSARGGKVLQFERVSKDLSRVPTGSGAFILSPLPDGYTMAVATWLIG